jgi:GNAT superfamily N-acetyltransferase
MQETLSAGVQRPAGAPRITISNSGNGQMRDFATLIRPMTVGDLPVVRLLLAQLGYELEPEEVERRFAAVTGSDAHALLVVESGERVTGFCHVYARAPLEKPPEAIVQALVVDRACRRDGIGRTMMAAAERWAAERGFRSVALASQIDREGAHAFYARLGYRRIATSHLLRKDIRL